MKKFFSTLFVALILTVTVVSPAFAFGPASIGRPAPAEPADEEVVVCYYGDTAYNPGEEFYRGSRPTLVCQSDGTWKRK